MLLNAIVSMVLTKDQRRCKTKYPAVNVDIPENARSFRNNFYRLIEI